MIKKRMTKSIKLENKTYYIILRRVTGMTCFVKPLPYFQTLVNITHTHTHIDDIRKIFTTY